MVGNVTGLPGRILFRGESNLGHDLCAHADFVRFGLTIPGGVPNAPGIRPDEIALASTSATSWDILGDAALATCAFPIAFRSRPLKRLLASLGYRVAAVPGEKPGTAEIAQLIPTWSAMSEDGSTPNYYRTANVDGGTFNNEPLDFVRTSLSGLAGRNKRDSTAADRGVVLISPFADPEQITLYDPPSLLGLVGPLISSMIMQARFKPEDVALATDYDTYSRFLVAPFGPGWNGVPTSGSSVIASGGLGGFIGFFNKPFLDYDFRLGRRNAYDFLTSQFVLPAGNPIFQGTWTTPQLNDHIRSDKNPKTGAVEAFLPIIPLMKSLRDQPPPAMTAADWPTLKASLTDLPDQVGTRLDALYGRLKDEGKNSWWPGWLGGKAVDLAWSTIIRGMLRDAFIKQVNTGLSGQHLL